MYLSSGSRTPTDMRNHWAGLKFRKWADLIFLSRGGLFGHKPEHGDTRGLGNPRETHPAEEGRLHVRLAISAVVVVQSCLGAAGYK